MEVKPGYKKTEIGIIPEDWKFQDILYLINNKDGIKIGPFGSQLKKELLTSTGYKVYGQENVYENNMDVGNRYISKQHYFKLKSCEIEKGDFIISMMGTIGKCVIVPEIQETGIMDSHLLRLRLNSKLINSKYLYHFFTSKSIADQIKKLSVGGIMDGLSSKIVKHLSIAIPSQIIEQQNISDALDCVDLLISTLDKIIAKKKLIKQGLMQELLTGKRRLPGFTGEWKSKEIGQISVIGRGRVISFTEINKANLHIYPVYSSQTTNDGVMGYIDTYDFDGEYATWTTDGVYAGRVFYRKGRFNCTNVCGTIKFYEDDCMFLSLLLNTLTHSYVSKQLANPKLMNEVMKKIKCQVPNLAEQQAIIQIISSYKIEIDTLEKERDKYKLIKQGMMQELLTGRIRLV